MQVTDICSTTTPYVQTKSTQTKSASTTPVVKSTNMRATQRTASNTPKSNSTIITNSASKTASVKCSSATIIATSSTTISYNGTSTTVKAAGQGGNASSSPKVTTRSNPSATIKSSTASATPYAYLAHMGGEAKYQVASILKKIEMYNGNLKINNVDDKELDIALKKFRDEFKVKTTSLYSEEMVEAIKNVGFSLTNLSTVKSQLAELDFYDQNGKEKIDPLDITGKYITNNYVEGLRNFCRVYNVEFSSKNIDKVLEKLKEVNDMYHQVVDRVTNKMVNSEFVVLEQGKSFGKMWTFFKLGMDVSDKVAAALMGNSFAESRLNEGQVWF